MTDRILLVEDDRKLAPLVRGFLEDHHFKVSWAADGDQGHRDFGRIKPDLLEKYGVRTTIAACVPLRVVRRPEPALIHADSMERRQLS
ncbi:MAG: CheY-like chemotaxis protein [Chlamydiales bacterium]